jgi:hypothetical protein
LYTQDELDRVAAELNGRPHKTLNWKKSIEAFEELIAKYCVAMTDCNGYLRLSQLQMLGAFGCF